MARNCADEMLFMAKKINKTFTDELLLSADEVLGYFYRRKMVPRHDLGHVFAISINYDKVLVVSKKIMRFGTE